MRVEGPGGLRSVPKFDAHSELQSTHFDVAVSVQPEQSLQQNCQGSAFRT